MSGDDNGHAAPVDRFNLAYCFLLLHGIGFLLPWNVFINAREYFVDYKLNTTTSYDADYRLNFMSYLGFAAHFPSLVFAAWNTFSQSGSSLSNPTFRFSGAMLVEVTVLLFTIAFTMVDTCDIPGTFFGITIVSVVLINCCVGIHQTLTFGMAAILPMKYSNAVIVGSNACGTIISLVNVLTKWLAMIKSRSRKSIVVAAVAYFMSSVGIVLACVITYFWLRRLEFVRYYSSLGNKRCIEVLSPPEGTSPPAKKANEHGTQPDANGYLPAIYTQGDEKDINETEEGSQGRRLLLKSMNAVEAVNNKNTGEHPSDQTLPHSFGSEESTGDEEAAEDKNDSELLRDCFGICCFAPPLGETRCRAYWSRYLACLSECWPHCLSIWSVFFCSLSVFPAIQSMIRPNNPNYWISPLWFVDVTCFFFFNLFAVLGCIVSNWIKIPGPRLLWIPVWIRTLLFIPFFLFCNFGLTNPKLPVLITNDHVYLAAVVIFAFTNGYFASLGIMYAPRNSPPERAELCGMLAAFFLNLGVFSGVYASRGLVSLVI
ncbi:unnamed protein product [Calicophoron daubneyi]|uniref:Equilibrative nucleoside transporter 3 n=1 Tax=Calicophoron daubneyi TaxID=300641 RepID=A0AAV2T2F5_CALDB